ncbi:MAG: EAL domain-containing protein [Acidimicrobiia bacterium]|nr:EAL domain-containing protein [Acidimicrobiia bacterium]
MLTNAPGDGPAPPSGEEARLQEAESLRRAFDSTTVGMALVSPDGRAIRVNAALCRILGRPEAEILDTAFLDAVHPDDRAEQVERSVRVLARDIDSWQSELRLCRPDGLPRWVLADIAAVRDEHGRTLHLVGLVTDVTERKQAERREAQLMEILRETADLVVLAEPAGPIRYANKAVRRLLGLGPDDPCEHGIEDLLATESAIQFRQDVLPAVAETGVWSGELALGPAAADAPLPVAASVMAHRDPTTGSVTLVSMIAHDVSELKEAQRNLVHEATHDALTGLPNRALLRDRLAQALVRGIRRPSSVAVMFVDLDRFKLVNDTLGHDAGDELLRGIGERLRGIARPGDVVARFGGDEFVVLCEMLREPSDALGVASRIEQALQEPFRIMGRDVYASASVGIAVAHRSSDPETLLRDADVAVYRAKENGRKRYELFDDEMRAGVQRRVETEQSLRRALDHGELKLSFRPVVDIVASRLTGFDAVIRWEQPERGVVPTEEFLPLAGEAGLGTPVCLFALEGACEQLARFARACPPGTPIPRVVVDLPARELTRPGLDGDLARFLDAAGVEPALLRLEISERDLMDDTRYRIGTLTRLKATGVTLSIDDFGTSYASLSYLRRLPVDSIRLDASLTHELGCSAEGTTVAAAVINLAHALGMTVVASGVRDIEHVAALLNLGCDEAEGPYFADPLPAFAAEGLLGRDHLP